MRRTYLLGGSAALLALVLVGSIAFVLRASTHQFAGLVSNPAPAAPDFTLTDESGQPFALSSLRGQWVLLTYGYTSCPDICPATLANLRQVKQQLGPQADQVRVVFTTVDPARDTVDVLRQYMGHFGADFKGLTGTPPQVAQAAQAYGVKYEITPSVSEVGYSVSHSAFVYLLDPRFHLRVTYPFGVEAHDIAADIRYLMSQEHA